VCVCVCVCVSMTSSGYGSQAVSTLTLSSDDSISAKSMEVGATIRKNYFVFIFQLCVCP
jgi:hypothetical protein